MGMTAMAMLAATPPPPYSRASSTSSLTGAKRASDVDGDSLRSAVLPIDALHGPLALLVDMPETAVLQHVEPSLRPLISGNIEAIARYSAEEEADAIDVVSERLGALGGGGGSGGLRSRAAEAAAGAQADDPDAPSAAAAAAPALAIAGGADGAGGEDESDGEMEAPAVAPPSLPSFGLGLKRQKSFGNSLVTEDEACRVREQTSRCALALSRLANRFKRRVSHATADKNNKSAAGGGNERVAGTERAAAHEARPIAAADWAREPVA